MNYQRKLLRYLRFYLVVCQFFGVAPTFPTPHGQNVKAISSVLHHFWSVLLLMYIYVTNYLQIGTIFSTLLIEEALYLSELLTNCVIATVIVIWCNYYSHFYYEIPIKLYEIDKRVLQYSKKRSDSHIDGIFKTLHKELLVYSCSAPVFFALCFVTDFIYNKFQWALFAFSVGAFVLPCMLITLNLGQYWLTLRFAALIYGKLNAVVNENMRGSDRRNWNIVKASQVKLKNIWYQREYLKANSENPDILSAIRSLYCELDNATSKFVNIYGLILLLNLIAAFLNLTVQIFGLYKFFDRPNIEALSSATYRFLWVFLQIVKIFSIFLTNDMIIKEKCRTSLILNDEPIFSHQMEHSINRFLLQLLVRNKTATACGIIQLDMSFIGGIVNALAMYVIFLIQIDLGNQSLGGGAVVNKSSSLPTLP